MCLGIPMRVESVDGLVANCAAKGIQRQVNLILLQDEPVRPGDYLVMHGGHAISILSEQEALAAWAVYDQILAAEQNPHQEQE